MNILRGFHHKKTSHQDQQSEPSQGTSQGKNSKKNKGKQVINAAAEHTQAYPSPSPYRHFDTGRESEALATRLNSTLGAKASRSKPIPTPKIVPERLQEKVDAIKLSKIKKLDTSLYDYAKNTINKIKSGQAPNADILDKDIEFLPLVAAAENKRNPGLNLHIFKSDQDCYNAIINQWNEVHNTGEKANIRAIFPPYAGLASHHVALDVMIKPGHSPSIVCIESSMMDNLHTLHSAVSSGVPGADIIIAPHGSQNSHYDCAMFSINNALKAYKNFNSFTSALHNQKRIAMPVSFIKHAHSHQFVQSSGLKNATVTSDKSGPYAETLEHRNLAYRADRVNKSYSTSIEGFRLQEIKRVADFLESQRSKKGKGIKSFF